MNEIKKCSISGVAFTLESAAYNRLNSYLQSLKEAYQGNPDSEEILADIEARIAELILSAHNNTESVVSLPIIENIITQLGSPEDISGCEQKGPASEETRIPRRLYRDLENAKLGGVCAGLAKYFGIDTTLVRLLVALAVLFVGFGLLAYIVCAFIIPEEPDIIEG